MLRVSRIGIFKLPVGYSVSSDFISPKVNSNVPLNVPASLVSRGFQS